MLNNILKTYHRNTSLQLDTSMLSPYKQAASEPFKGEIRSPSETTEADKRSFTDLLSASAKRRCVLRSGLKNREFKLILKLGQTLLKTG